MNTKKHILRVSLRLFLQKSYKEVTMKEIVEETGLSKGAFYHHFTGKEELFREIIQHFFTEILEFDFDRLPSETLHEFYRAYADQVNTLRFQLLSGENQPGEDFIDLNFFALLFDAFKLFPGFRKQMEQYHRKETGAWIRVIGNSRQSGEISAPLTDDQIARIFMYTGDGLTMNLTMDRDTAALGEKLASLWDQFYATLKTKKSDP